MIKFKRYPYRVGETYGMNGGLTQRQIIMAINKPVRQAKKLQAKAPLLAELITAEPIQDFDAKLVVMIFTRILILVMFAGMVLSIAHTVG